MGNAKVVSNFVIVKCGRCILGNTTAKELGVLHISPKASPIGAGSDKYFLQNLSLGKWHVKVTCQAG